MNTYVLYITQMMAMFLSSQRIYTYYLFETKKKEDVIPYSSLVKSNVPKIPFYL